MYEVYTSSFKQHECLPYPYCNGTCWSL